MGDQDPQQRLAGVRPQPRPLHPVPDAHRSHRAGGRRGRGRQCRQGRHGAQTRQPGGAEGTRRPGVLGLRHGPRAGHAGGAARRSGRCRDRRGPALSGGREFRRVDPAAARALDPSRRIGPRRALRVSDCPRVFPADAGADPRCAGLGFVPRCCRSGPRPLAPRLSRGAGPLRAGPRGLRDRLLAGPSSGGL